MRIKKKKAYLPIHEVVYFVAEVYLVPLYSHATSLGLLLVKACLNMHAARFYECADVLQVSKYFGPYRDL